MSSSYTSLPLVLPPPPPRFPQTFAEHDREQECRNPEVERADYDERMTGRRGVGIDQPLKWEIQTDQERHVQRLEDQLERLSKSQQTRGPPDLAEPDLAQLEQHHADTIYDFGPAEPTRGEARDRVRQDDDDEGRPLLLSIAETSNRTSDDEDDIKQEEEEERDNEADLSGNDDELHHGPSLNDGLTAAQRISFSHSVRISGGIHTRPHRHRHRLAAPADSVSAFPRRSSSNERYRDARPQTAPSPLLVASVTSSNANTPSRATSPAGRAPSASHYPSLGVGPIAPRPRRLSSSSHVSSSNNFASSASMNYYSVSPGSQVASTRGSSPCSSIYAPLQPPSKHTPNPFFVRPSPRLQRQRSSGSGGTSGLSFQEYLREGYDAFNDAGSDDEDELDDSDGASGEIRRGNTRSPGYRELVEQQRKKRALWEQRKRRKLQDDCRRDASRRGEDIGAAQPRREEEGGFWNGLKRWFSRSSTSYGSGVGRAGGSFGSPTVFRSSSRLPANANNYGSTTRSPSHQVSTLSPAPSAPPPAQPRSILAASPALNRAMSPPRPGDPFASLPPTSRTRSRTPSSQFKATAPSPPPPLPPPRPSSSSSIDKPESNDDSRQASCPFTFLLRQFESFLLAVQSLFETAGKGLAKQREQTRKQRERDRLLSASSSPERPRRQGYQAV